MPSPSRGAPSWWAGLRPLAACVYLFNRDRAGVWHQTAELKGPAPSSYDGFGDAVAISDGTVVVGALLHADLLGSVYVFSATAGGWHESAQLTGILAKSYFGKSVAISGGTVVVGATGSSSGTGWAYVFTKTASGGTGRRARERRRRPA